ncbi:MAG TPA: CoA pyrophosphatase [Gemmatimonadaceae bacterium]
MNPLDALRSHPTVEQLERALRGRPGQRLDVEGEFRRAAVVLTLRGGQGGELELLLIKRATYEGDPWSGHIALPGGRQEPDDPSLEATAVRETREEIGIDLARDGCIIGSLDDVRPRTVRIPSIVISPFVALLARDVPLVLSEEVAEAFWVPLAVFQAPDAVRDVVLQLEDAPRTVKSFQHGGYIIWGLTERILEQLLQVLA